MVEVGADTIPMEDYTMQQNDLSIEVMIRDFKIIHRDYHRAQRAGSRSAALLNRIMAARIAERLMRRGLTSADIARMELEAEAEADNA